MNFTQTTSRAKARLVMILTGFLCVSSLFWTSPNVSAQKGFIPTYKQQAIRLENVSVYKPFVVSKAKIDLSEYVKEYQLLQLEPAELKRIMTDKPQQWVMALPQKNGDFMYIHLVASNPLAENKGVHVQAGKRRALNINFQHGLFYHGVVRGKLNSTVAISVFNNQIIGMVMDETGNYDLGVLQSHVNGVYQTPKNLISAPYSFYNRFDVIKEEPFHCGASEFDNIKDQIKKKSQDPNNNEDQTQTSTTCKDIVFYFECDSFLYARRGHSVPNTVNFVTGMFNALNAIYINENLHVSLGDIKVWTLNDPYKNMAGMGSMLNELRDNQIPVNPYTWNLCVMLTTKGRDWGGLAWVDVLCASRGYRASINYIYNSYSPLPAYSWTLNVIAHETGHNFGSPHTQSCSWIGGAIDGCVAVEGSCTRPPAADPGTIMSYCHVATRVDLNLGYGPLPGDLIRNRVAAAACLPLFTVTADIVSPTQNPYQLTCQNTVRLQSTTCTNCTYQWNLNGNPILNATQSFYDASLAGDYTVTVSKAACGTVTSAILTIVLVPPTPPTITGLNSPYTNQQGPVTMIGTPSGGTFSGNGVSGSQFNPSVAGVGIHNITYAGTDINGCPFTVTVQVEVLACPVTEDISPANPVLCVNQSVNLSVSNNPNYTYQWKRNNVDIPNATQSTYSASQAGNYTVAIGMLNCNTVVSPVRTLTLVVVNPRITGYRNPYLISSPAVRLTGSPSGGTFSGPGISGNTFNPSLAGAGTHVITYSGISNGCNYSTTVNLTVLPPSNCVNNSTQIVPGPTVIMPRQVGAVNLLVSQFPNTTYQWAYNSVDIPGAIYRMYRATQTGNYTVRINQLGCPSYTTNVCTVVPQMRTEGDDLANNSASWIIFPNPAKDYITLQYNNNAGNPINIAGSKISLMDILGKTLAIQATPSPEGFTMDVSTLAKGIYLIQIEEAGIYHTHKLIID